MSMTLAAFQKKFAAAHPGSQVEVVKFAGVKKPVILHCPIHGEVIASSGSNAVRTVHACPACGKETGLHALRTSPTFKVLSHKSLTEDELQKRLSESPTPDCKLVGRESRYRVTIRCPRHGEVVKNISSLSQGCPICAAERPRHRRTKAQIAADNAKKTNS